MKFKKKGAAMLEYGLLAGLVAVVSIATVATSGQKVRDALVGTSNTLSAAMIYTGVSDPQASADPAPPSFTCPSQIQVDGSPENVVQIGTQCWMSRNLNVATPQSVCYDNLQSNCDTYGRLYQMVSNPDVNAYCPEGWRIPFDEDWANLERELGMDEAQIYLDSGGSDTWRTSGDVEEQLANFVSGGTNSSGFNALPAGYYVDNNSYRLGTAAIFLNQGSANWRYLRADIEGVNRRNGTPYTKYYISARCMTSQM